MPNPRHLVAPPSSVPRPFGLLSVAEVRDDPDPHWRNGVNHEAGCGGIGVTWDGCAVDDDIAPKAGARGVPRRVASAITLYAVDDCAAPGRTYQQARDRATRILLDGEGPTLEVLIEQGRTSPFAGGSPIDDEAMPLTFASDATLGPPLGDAPSIEAAVATAEFVARSGVVGSLGVLHLPSVVASVVGQRGGLIRNGARLETALGTPVVVGNYLAASDVVSIDGGPDDSTIAYLWVTGPLVVYRGEVTPVGASDVEVVDRAVNTRALIVERTYSVSWDCRTVAIPFPLSEIYEP